MTRRRMGQRGSSVLEFAVLAPVFLLMALGVIEIGMQGAVHVALDISARNASRLGSTGTIGASGTNGAVATDADRQTAMRNLIIISATGKLLNSGNLTITQQAYNTAADATAGQNAVSGPGGAGRFVRYTLTYLQPTYAGDWSQILMRLFGSSSALPTTFVHTSTILVTNEPFQS